jgi:hypothetical protein
MKTDLLLVGEIKAIIIDARTSATRAVDTQRTMMYR